MQRNTLLIDENVVAYFGSMETAKSDVAAGEETSNDNEADDFS